MSNNNTVPFTPTSASSPFGSAPAAPATSTAPAAPTPPADPVDKLRDEIHAWTVSKTVEMNNVVSELRTLLDARTRALDATVADCNNQIAELKARIIELEQAPPAQVVAASRGARTNPPEIFDGTREKGDAFLQSLSLYFRSSPRDFPREEDKITVALSYMTQGRAATFRGNALEFASTHREQYEWPTFEAFKEVFRKEFTPISANQDAIHILETPAYHQAPAESLDDYIDRVRTLVKKSGMETMGAWVVLKFKAGLSHALRIAARDLVPAPASDDPEAWYDSLRAVETSRAQYNVMGKPKPTTAPAPAHIPRTTTAQAPAARPAPFVPSATRPAVPTPPARSTPALWTPKPANSGPTPMEIDADRAHTHRRFNLRALDTEELEQELARRRDLMDVAAHEEFVEESGARTEEDFGTPSE